MFIPDPDFFSSRIPDQQEPISQNGKSFLCMNRYRKFFSQLEKNGVIFRFNRKKLYEAFRNMGWGYGIRDPRSGKNFSLIPDPELGIKKHRIPDLVVS
jgi:hypothetical protein